MLVLVAAGFALWLAHARAWDLGRRSPVLGFDAAQYALAARTLAEQGKLGTTFALPIELVKHPSPPWPLAAVQPGLVLAEAAVDRLVPPVLGSRQRPILTLQMPHQREWLTLVIPFVSYLMLTALLALLTARLIARHAPAATAVERAAAALTVGGAFLLDPEAQHFAIGAFTELPYTLGLVAAIAWIAIGRTPAPLLFGLLLGVTGAFRGNLLWLAPWLAAGAAALAPEGRRRRAFALVMLGYALPLLPWWIYKWRTFGHPAWDLSALALWDGVGTRTWFSLTHLPAMPDLPRGWEAVSSVAGKLARNTGPLLLGMTVGPRGLWIGAIVVWLVAVRGGARPLKVAGWIVLVHAAIAVIVAGLGAGWLRYLFPARVPLEAAGVLASWALLGRVPPQALGPQAVQAARVAVVALALGWGGWQTARGNAEAAATVASRGLPSVSTLRDLGHRLRRELAPGEPVMSNLGPTLAWYARRPVVHLALTPADVDACRARLPFRHVVIAFREVEHAWRGWDELVRDPGSARANPGWNVRDVRAWRTHGDGFTVVWVELAPMAPSFALAGGR